MRTPLIIAAPLLAIVLAAIVVALLFVFGPLKNDGGQPSTVEGQIAGGGETPPYYLEPVPLTSGDYISSSFPFEAVAEKGLALEEAEREKPQFEGTINGFRIYSIEHAMEDPSVRKEECVVARFELTSQMTFGYLPPGTFARSPQYAGICPDGSISWILQEFLTKHGSFDIGYQAGERAFGYAASSGRVQAAEVGGQPAVIIRPLIPEGFGQFGVAVATENGFIIVDVRATGLPLSEIMKIAEGVQCEGC